MSTNTRMSSVLTLLYFQWSFLANMLVVNPGQTYRVSVFNIPKPEQGHSVYDISRTVTVHGE